MNLDMTLLDVKQEDGCIKILKKPMFAYIDYETMPGRCLLYLVDTSDCWDYGSFDGSKAKIKRQVPRSYNPDRVDGKLVPNNPMMRGKSGVYQTEAKELFAIKSRVPFFINDVDSEQCRVLGSKGDWIVSDGNKNKFYTDNELKEQFVLAKPYDLKLDLRRPGWERDRKGMPTTDFKLLSFGR